MLKLILLDSLIWSSLYGTRGTSERQRNLALGMNASDDDMIKKKKSLEFALDFARVCGKLKQTPRTGW